MSTREVEAAEASLPRAAPALSSRSSGKRGSVVPRQVLSLQGAEGAAASGSSPSTNPDQSKRRPKSKLGDVDGSSGTAALQSGTTVAPTAKAQGASEARPKSKRKPTKPPVNDQEGQGQEATQDKESGRKRPDQNGHKNDKMKQSDRAVGNEKSTNGARWWSRLRDVDPITLMPLSSLREPPFELQVDNSDLKHRFDGKALALYLLSTGNFVDPINRQPLTREDCARLDAHLRQYGMGEQAKCLEMIELQNSIKTTSEVSAAGERAVNILRRDATVLASQLFHYPSVRDSLNRRRDTARTVQTSHTGSRTGGVTVTDDDDQWQTWPENEVPRVPQEEFPEMPTIRRRPIREEFPPIGAVRNPPQEGASTSAAVAPRPAASPISWATVAETAKTKKIQVGASQAAAIHQQDSSVGSWRSAAERPKLNLVLLEPTRRIDAETATTQRSESIFGKAVPVDNAFLFKDDRAATQNMAQATDYLCPYPPKLLKAAKTLGPIWLAGVEKRLKELVEAATSRRTLRLDPMPEPRRNLLYQIGTRFWGLQVVELDPEPATFQEFSATPVSFVPDMMLHKAVSFFPTMSTSEFSGSGSSNGILFIGVASSVTPNRVHDLMRDILQARPSEYDVVMLDGYRPDEKNVFIEVSSNERARRFFKKLSSAPVPGFRCRKVEWWPCGLEWAKFQIRQLGRGSSGDLDPARAQRKLDERRHRNEDLANSASTGWDDAVPVDKVKLETLRAKLQAKAEWDDDKSSTDEDDSDSDSSDE